MKFHTLKIDKSYSLEDAWQFFEQAGYSVAYGEEGEDLLLHLFLNGKQLPQESWILEHEVSEKSIDWDAQWALHGFNYENGFLQINLSEFGKEGTLQLKPGPGFGDLSHPTTRLALRLIAKTLQGELVVDIGSGSGILALAAIQWGALFAFGIDIDEEALKHANENSVINGIENKCLFCLPHHCTLFECQPMLIAMNMISSEQASAWDSLSFLHDRPAKLVISGILKTEKDNYLRQIEVRQWTLVEEMEEEGWLALHFKNYK